MSNELWLSISSGLFLIVSILLTAGIVDMRGAIKDVRRETEELRSELEETKKRRRKLVMAIVEISEKFHPQHQNEVLDILSPLIENGERHNHES